MEKAEIPKTLKSSLIALLILTSVLPFLPGLKAPFFYDDLNTIVMNPSIRSAEGYGKFFYQLETFSADQARMFRPLVLLSLALNWKWFQNQTLGFHLTNLLAHILCVILTYFLIERLSGSWQLAFLSALFFGIHPSRVEPVLYLSARSELFASLFYLSAFLLFLKSQAQEKKFRELWFGILSVLSFWLGLASKDITITLPAVMTLERVVFRRFNRRAIFWVIIFWINALLYFLLRRVLGLSTFFPPARPRGVLENLLLQARVIVYYLGKLIFPLHNTVEVKFSPLSTLGICLSVLLLLILIAIGFYLIFLKPRLGFFIFFFFIVLSPSSSVIPLVVEGNIVRVYLAGLGGFILLAELFLSAIKSSFRPWAFLALTIYFLSLLSLSLNWAKEWNSPRKLWWETVKNFPKHSRAHNNLGIQLEHSGNYAQAEREYLSAVKSGPQNASALVNYGRMLFAREEFARAELYYRKALLLEPHSCPGRINYSQLLITMARISEAKEILEEISFCPGYENELAQQKKRVNDLLHLP